MRGWMKRVMVVALVRTFHRGARALVLVHQQVGRGGEQRRMVHDQRRQFARCHHHSDSWSDAKESASSRSEKISLYGLQAEGELEALLASWGEPKYRAAQVRDWLKKGVTEFGEMSSLSKSLRGKLEEHVEANSLRIAAEQKSKDGTLKRAYELRDGRKIESVLMRYEKRATACISSQAGCAMGCVFCATGQMGFQRQLTAGEIFEQAARFDVELKREDDFNSTSRLSNVVFMGMGEPLLNYHAVSKAIHLLQAELGISARRITVSTVGVVPAMAKLRRDHPHVGLAISLHAADDAERSALLPANDRYGRLEALMTAAFDHWTQTKRRVTFEWALILGQNDDVSTARALGALLKRFHLAGPASHVNVIPLNPTTGFHGTPSNTAAVDAFLHVLRSQFRVSATVRLRRGIDIDAGCGQLANQLTTSSSPS